MQRYNIIAKEPNFLLSITFSILIGKLIGYWVRSLGFAGLAGLNLWRHGMLLIFCAVLIPFYAIYSVTAIYAKSQIELIVTTLLCFLGITWGFISKAIPNSEKLANNETPLFREEDDENDNVQESVLQVNEVANNKPNIEVDWPDLD